MKALFIISTLLIVSFSAPAGDLVNHTEAKLPDYFKNPFYAGYLNVTSEKQFYYWFIQKDANPERAPVVLWLNGGPGCSSLLGAISENGPFLFNDGKVGFRPTPNDYAWTKVANVIFMESPGGVGFSLGPKQGEITDYQTGEDNKIALLDFFVNKFPEFAGNDFYIAGESYAGTYIPYTVYAIDSDSDAKARINLKGWAVGNGCTLPQECVPSEIKFTNDSSSFIYDFLYNQNKYSEATQAQFNKYCNDDPNGPDCKNIRGQIQLETGLASNNATIGGLINPYDIYAYCYHETDPDARYSPLKYLLKNLAANASNSSGNGSSSTILPCDDVLGALAYFRNADMRKALHVSPNASVWEQCSDTVGQRYVNAKNASYWIYPLLVGKGYKVMIYSGDTDSVVPITGTLTWIEKLRKDLGLTLKAPWRPWFYPGNAPDNARQVGGFALEFDQDFSFVSVRGVGHMVPQWGPKKAYQMIKSYLYEDGMPSS